MFRFNFVTTKEQIEFLKSLPGTSSEHIRRAIDDYKLKIEGQAVISPSKNLKKGGIKHGSTN
jgi:hypothetical protein